MTTEQKTLVDLLDLSPEHASVRGKSIVKRFGGRRFRVLWTFESNQQAIESYNRWVIEAGEEIERRIRS